MIAILGNSSLKIFPRGSKTTGQICSPYIIPYFLKKVKGFCEISRIWRKKVYINFIYMRFFRGVVLDETPKEWYNIMGYYDVTGNKW
jgi:hypothetical protein